MVAISVPSDGLFVQIDMDLLGFQILFYSPRPQFSSEAGLLVASPWCFHISGLHVIHPYDAGAQRFHSPESFENVSRPHSCGQAVRRIVRNPDRILLIFKRNHSCDGTEDLFSRNSRIIIGVIKDCRFDVVAFRELLRTTAAAGQLAFLLAHFLVGTYPVILLFTHKRSHFRIAVQRRAQLDLLRLLGHSIDKFLVNRFLYQDSASGGADFTLIDEDPKKRTVYGSLEIRVSKENIG